MSAAMIIAVILISIWLPLLAVSLWTLDHDISKGYDSKPSVWLICVSAGGLLIGMLLL